MLPNAVGASKSLSYWTSLLPLTWLIHPSTIFSHPLLYTWWARVSLAFWLSISNLTYSLDFYPVFSQFWNFNLHQKHLAGLLKQIPDSGFSYSRGLGSRMKIYVSHKFPGDADPAGLQVESHLRITACLGFLFYFLPLNVHFICD